MSSPTIDLIYETDCPNAPAARALLRAALDAVGCGGSWREWNRSGEEFPERFEGYGSPTILVDGADVSGESGAADANSCRVYVDQGQVRGVPTLDEVTAALQAARAALP